MSHQSTFFGLAPKNKVWEVYDEIPVCVCGEDWTEHLSKRTGQPKAIVQRNPDLHAISRKPRRVLREPVFIPIPPPQTGRVTSTDSGKQRSMSQRRFMPASIHYFLNEDGVRLPNPITKMLEGRY
jgi:hypothetical protein